MGGEHTAYGYPHDVYGATESSESSVVNKPTSEDADEWDARFYHDVMGAQQLKVGQQLFEFMPDVGSGLIIDAGCGSGLVADAMLQRYSEAHVLAVDLSADMLRLARVELANWPTRVAYCQADLQDFCQPNSAAVIFSNAAMHWVPDHTRLFTNMFATLRPSGVLAVHMACSGPHNRGLFACLRNSFAAPPFDSYCADYTSPVECINPAREAAAMDQAGFVDIKLERLSHIFTFRSVPEHRLFMEKVVLRRHMALLPNETLRELLIDQVLDYTDNAIGPMRQCYESLRCVARRP